MGNSMKLKIYYDSETDTLSLWNGHPASEADDVAENLVADFSDGRNSGAWLLFRFRGLIWVRGELYVEDAPVALL